MAGLVPNGLTTIIIAALLSYLRLLQPAFRVAVLFVHHARKDVNSTRPGQVLRASSELPCRPELQTLSTSELTKIRLALAPSSLTNTCVISLSLPRQKTPIGRLGNPLRGSTRSAESRCSSGVSTARPAPSPLRT